MPFYNQSGLYCKKFTNIGISIQTVISGNVKSISVETKAPTTSVQSHTGDVVFESGNQCLQNKTIEKSTSKLSYVETLIEIVRHYPDFPLWEYTIASFNQKLLLKRKQLYIPRAGNPENVLLTSMNRLKYFYQ